MITREVKPVPAAEVPVATSFPATSRAFGAVVVSAPLLLVALVPVPATTASTGFEGSTPLYSRMRMSGQSAEAPKPTVTLFAPAPAATMFAA